MDPHRAGVIERTIRRLQVPRGRAQLLRQIAAVGGDSSRRSASGDASYRGSASGDASYNETTLAVINRLARPLDALPQRATLPDWARAWPLAHETGLLRAMDGNDDERRRAEGGGRKTEAPGSGRSAVGSQSAISNQQSTINPPPSALRPPPSLLPSDHRAWGRLMEAAAETDRLADWLCQRPPELDRRAALDTLREILSGDRVGHAGDESGQVRVLQAESIRSLRIPYLFLAGLSEKAFPPPEREDRLYSEAEYLRLIDAGLPLVARTERTREEMLLFYEAITRAGKRLYLSYPAMDDAAQPLLPSPLLTEVEQAFGGKSNIARTEQNDLSPIPPGDEPLCEADFRVKAMATALAGNVALLAGLFQGDERRAEGGGRKAEEEVGNKSEIRNPKSEIPPPPSVIPSPLSPLPSSLCSPLAAGLELIDLRQDRGFGPAEGLLQGVAAHYYLATQFHPQHVFAATDLERYASCPFRFLMERVLAIEPIEDLALEFDVLHRGRVVHDVLATFHRRVNERLGRPASPLELDRLDPAAFDSLLAAAIQDSLPAETANLVQAALREVDRRLVVDWLSQYREQLRKIQRTVERFRRADGGRTVRGVFRPRRPAAAVGRQTAGVCPARPDVPHFRPHRPHRRRPSGRKGRVQRAGLQDGASIKLTPESIHAGTTLQLPLYAIAAMELLLADRDAVPWRAGYWYIREGGFKPRQALRMYRNDDGHIELERDWEDIRDSLGNVVAGWRRPFAADNSRPQCRRALHQPLPFSTVCRVNQVRSFGKEMASQPSISVANNTGE